MKNYFQGLDNLYVFNCVQRYLKSTKITPSGYRLKEAVLKVKINEKGAKL